MRTYCPCDFSDGVSARGLLVDKRIERASRETFLRVCEVFGVKWVDDLTTRETPTRQPTLGDWLSFLTSFIKTTKRLQTDSRRS